MNGTERIPDSECSVEDYQLKFLRKLSCVVGNLHVLLHSIVDGGVGR